MRHNTAVLFMTHQWNRLMRLKWERLRTEIEAVADVWILMPRSHAVHQMLADLPDVQSRLAVFDQESLPAFLGYPYSFHDAISPGSIHFPLIAFFRERAEYDHCFLIENDVEFSGHWGHLVTETLVRAPDFASLHFFSYDEKPHWFWWPRYRPGAQDLAWGRSRSNLRRSFNPVYCLSRRAAMLIDEAHRSGWRGHQEMILATISSRHGCRLVDLGADCGFCVGREQNHGPGILPEDVSTVRWRPEVTVPEFIRRSTGRTLFHPIKQAWFFDGTGVVDVAETR